MRYSTFIAPLTLLTASVGANAASCDPVFASESQSVTLNGIEISPGAIASRDIQLRVRNAANSSDDRADAAPANSKRCPATIRISRLGMPIDPEFPPFTLSAPGQRQIEILPDPQAGGSTKSDITIVNAPSGPQGRAVPFQIGVLTEWGLKAGTYTEQLELSLVNDSGTIVDRTTLTITIVVPPAVSLRLVGAVTGGAMGGPVRIDLGNLSTTAETRSQPFAARILSTAPYVVNFSSTNLGRLAHDQANAQIAYRLYFDNSLVDLAVTNDFPYLSATPRSGDSRPMRIVVPAVTALAGRYSDQITITVSAL